MKRRGVVFDLKKRSSNEGGAKKTYYCPDEVRPVLGQGQKLLFHARVTERTGYARLTFSLREACAPGAIPRDDGFTVTPDGGSVVITGTGNFRFTVTGPLMAEVEVLAEVDASEGQGIEAVEFELAVTVDEG
jgi:hypothetical protein